MSFRWATWTSIVVLFAATDAIRCPQMCSCRQPTDYQLTVDCGSRGINASVLSEELDLLLSEEELREHLTFLRIRNTPLTQVPGSVCRLSNLTYLCLDHNRLTRLPDNCFTNMTSLGFLSASKNLIGELQDGLFDGLNSLNELRFEDNRISAIGPHLFSNQSDLISLKVIALKGNKLRSLEPWPVIRGLHGSPDSKVVIDLFDNRISNFTNNVQWQLDCPTWSYADVSLAWNNIRHLNDIWVGWNITPTTRLFCLFPVAAGSRRISPFKFDTSCDREYKCDCQDFPVHVYQRKLANHAFLENVECSQPPNLAGRLARQVPIEDFVCELTDRCPTNCRCAYRPANATLHVYCSAVNLSSLPLDLPPLPKSYVRYKLDFSDNRLLRRLEHRSYFANASVLDASNCSISVVDISAWRDFAKMQLLLTGPRMYLHNNEIESVPFEVTGIDLRLGTLILNNNPWKCSCDNRWMIAWFKSLSSAFPTGGDVLCASPSRLKGRSIAQSSEDEFCTDPATRMLKISLSSTLSAVAALLLSGFAVYRLRVRLYRRWKFHPFDRDECVGEEMDYDVFLCSSSQDFDPHGSRVLQLMESNGYRVCYHDRDFLPGTLITDNMAQSITRSKRTLCLLSNNFLQR